MLLGGKGGCQQCTCVPCDACTRTCQNPYTGTEFEAVYTRKFEGAEAGNPSDGYLNATGDSDSSDPYNGMDGTGPWFQQVSGAFSDGGSSSGGTRFPCTYRFSFWRSSYTLGVGTIPPASTALTMNKITVNVSYGAVVFPDGRVFTSADGPVELASIPLVSGGASAVDPRTFDGTVSFALQCQNVETQFSVQARIEWATQKRQHVLYGIVRECYEDDTGGGPCATFCDGSPPNEVLYLTISNYTGPELASGSPNGTYVLERVPNYCEVYEGGWQWGCGQLLNGYMGGDNDTHASRNYIYAASKQVINGECKILILDTNIENSASANASYCGSGVLGSGTNGIIYFHTRLFGALPEDIVSGSFDWEIST